VTPQELIKTELDPILKRVGYSTYFSAVKIQLKRRLQIAKADRPNRVHATPAEKQKMFDRQQGKCPWRSSVKENPHMLLIPASRNECDEINPNLTEGYNAKSNKQLLCPDCNREKSSMSIEEQAVDQGKTMAEILAVPHGEAI